MSDRIDVQALGELKEIMEEDFGLLLDQYISASLELIGEMGSDLSRGDSEALSRNAHTLKGSSMNVGANILAERCGELEQQAKVPDANDLEALIRSIAQEYQEMVRDLETLRQQM